jgi:hypothetical protein
MTEAGWAGKTRKEWLARRVCWVVLNRVRWDKGGRFSEQDRVQREATGERGGGSGGKRRSILEGAITAPVGPSCGNGSAEEGSY